MWLELGRLRKCYKELLYYKLSRLSKNLQSDKNIVRLLFSKFVNVCKKDLGV
jgi:hypothetical protein